MLYCQRHHFHFRQVVVSSYHQGEFILSDTDLVIEAFTELAPVYENTVNNELNQFWGISYRDFIHELLSRVYIGNGDLVLDVATGTGVIPQGLVERSGDSGLRR